MWHYSYLRLQLEEKLGHLRHLALRSFKLGKTTPPTLYSRLEEQQQQATYTYTAELGARGHLHSPTLLLRLRASHSEAPRPLAGQKLAAGCAPGRLPA